MNYNNRYQPAILLLVLFFLSSCIKDNLSKCPDRETDGLWLGFRLGLQVGNDLQASDVSSLDVFVFNEANVYHGCYRIDAPHMEDDAYRIHLPLPTGTYSFVVWGNIGSGSDYSVKSATLVEGSSLLSEARLSFLRPANDTVNYAIGSLFYGSTLQTHVVGGIRQEVFVPMSQNTYIINLEIAGLQDNLPLCRAVINGSHDAYDFLNNEIASSPLYYSQICTLNENEQRASLHTLRLKEDSPSRLKIYGNVSSRHIRNTGDVLLYDASLIDLIRTAMANSGSSMDLDMTHTYTVRLSFDKTQGEFTVTVNGWNAQEEEHNITPQR